jgi:hypothetical protein
MATKLNKKITREVENWCHKGVFGLGGASSRSLLVSLEPGNIISFREKGTRTSYDIDIETVYNMAVKRTFINEQADKGNGKKKRKVRVKRF